MIVTTIGSCRILVPMTRQQANFGYVVDNRVLYGLTHTTKDTLQLLAYVNGDLKIPRDIWKFISEQQYREADSANRIVPKKEQAFVVELSSLKVLKYRDLTLQAVRFNDSLYGTRKLRRIFFDYPSERDLAMRIELLESEPEFAKLPPVFRSVLTETVQLVQDYDEIKDDLRKIKCTLGDSLIVVPHCNAVDSNGELLEDRAKGVQWVLDACRELDIPTVDPGSLLQEFGQELGMEKEGRDTAHFTPAFANVVGDAICTQLFGGDARVTNAAVSAVVDWRAGVEQAKLFARSKEWDQALLFANRVLDLNPSHAGAKLVRARAVTAMGQTDDMYEAWRQALDLHQNHTSGSFRLGAQCMLQLGHFALAVAWAKRCYELRPDAKSALVLAEAYARNGMWIAAQDMFSRYALEDKDAAITYAAHPRRNTGDAGMVVAALLKDGSTDSRVAVTRERVWKQAVKRAAALMKLSIEAPNPDDYNAIEVLAPDAAVAARYTARAANFLLVKYQEDEQWSLEGQTRRLIQRFMTLRTIKEKTLAKAARLLQESGEEKGAAELWGQVARLAEDSALALKAADRVVKLGAIAVGIECYRLLREREGADVALLNDRIDRGIRGIIRTFKGQLAESNLVGADESLAALNKLDPGHRNLRYFRRMLGDAFKVNLASTVAPAEEQPALKQKLAIRILQLNPNDSDANIELAYSYLRNGQIAEGQQIINQLNPADR